MGECSTQPLLTVIIPVYKAVETLGPCLESILSQGVQALQVVLIVDGSPDESGLLCDEWAKKDGRIQVIHQPNRGASAARMQGLAAAKGRYITFVDADDRLLPGCMPAPCRIGRERPVSVRGGVLGRNCPLAAGERPL